MPQTDTLRRCAFKVPKNGRYQCQKAGDKHQLHVDLWYCRFHDRHAKDRCQALIEWAGKGAQCEQLGAWDGVLGMKVCAWHSVKGREVVIDDDDEVLDTKMQDCLAQRESALLSSPPTMVDSDCEPHIQPASTSLENEEQPSHSPAAKEIPDEIDPDPTTVETKKSKLTTDGDDGNPHTEPSSNNNDIVDTHHTSIPTPSPSSVETATTPPPNPPLSPTQPTLPSIHKTYTHVLSSLLTTFPPRPRTDSLSPLPSSPPRTPAQYAQCCICLEKHSESVMRRVGACAHQYRELCLRKVGRDAGGARRRYNCRGCGEMVGRVG